MYVLYIVVCAFVIFLSAIVLSVLRFTDSDSLFGIFKLFLALIYVLYVIVTSYIRSMDLCDILQF